MKALKNITAVLTGLTCFTLLLATIPARASDAETSASATGGRGTSGTAAATARYEGDVGFARTDTRTGKINLARGVAVGVDEDGVSLSLSLAIAPKNGPAVATNVNLTFNRDGTTAVSTGRSVAAGGTTRTVTVAGRTTATRHDTVATSTAAGHTTNGGTVRAETHSDNSGHREIRPIRLTWGR
jgi:hypothetical protein